MNTSRNKNGVSMRSLFSQRTWRLSTARIISQVFFFSLFLFFVWASWTSRLGGYPVSRLLEIDPLIMIPPCSRLATSTATWAGVY